jgi:hypothetical protein
MSDVTTWADGYGRWHARMRDTGDPDLNEQIAQCAILADLRLRFSGVEPDLVTVRRVRPTRRVPGMPSGIEYVEDCGERAVHAAA